MNDNVEQRLPLDVSPDPPTTGANLRGLAEAAVQLEQQIADRPNTIRHGVSAQPLQDVQVGRRETTVWWAPFQQLDDLAFLNTVQETAPQGQVANEQEDAPLDTSVVGQEPRPEGIDLVTSEPGIDWEDTDEDDTDEEELDWPGDPWDVDIERILRNIAEGGTPGRRPGNIGRNAMTEAVENRPTSPKCRACLDDVDDGIHAGCGHAFCKDCFNNYVKVSLQDRSSFPPVCCTQIFDIAQLRDHLDEDVLILVDARWDEWSDKSPTYCFDCSKYLKDDADGEYKHCSCGCLTSIICKVGQAYHLVQGVHPEKVDHQVQQLASKKGWKKCPGCLTLVARRNGCDHMQCSCKTFFCYRCGTKLPDQRPCRCRTRDIDLERRAGEQYVVRWIPVQQSSILVQPRSFSLELGPLLHPQADTTGAEQLAGLDVTNGTGGRNDFVRYLVWWAILISVASVLSTSVIVWVAVLFLASVGSSGVDVEATLIRPRRRVWKAQSGGRGFLQVSYLTFAGEVAAG